MIKVAIIGAGAAGCFCAAHLRRGAPEMVITVFEAGPKALSKVAITGGGRCNLTNSFEDIRSLSEAYPRGERVMKRALKAFSQEDTIQWFTERGVPCVLQEDHCWFPQSQDAMDIVRCLLREMKGVELRLNTPVTSVVPGRSGHLMVNGELFDFVVVTTGGAPKGLPFLNDLNLEIVPPVPSLFTLNIPERKLTALMGLVVDASVCIPDTNFKASGPLLITDWGISGPATLKLSSYAARYLAQNKYNSAVAINWLDKTEAQVREQIIQIIRDNPQKQIVNTHLLQQRLWEYLFQKTCLRKDIRWAELGSKGLNKLVATLTCDTYHISGRGRFRDEFVTAGGVALGNIDLSTLESKAHKGLYFAGEVLDIDAITGGFNLQAAWSTGYVCAHSISGSGFLGFLGTPSLSN